MVRGDNVLMVLFCAAAEPKSLEFLARRLVGKDKAEEVTPSIALLVLGDKVDNETKSTTRED